MSKLQSVIFRFTLLCSAVGILASCRTAKPKDETLDPSTMSSTDDDARLELDVDPNASSAAMWSPAQRKANASFQYLVAMKTILQGDIKRALPVLESSYNLDPNSYTGSQLVEVRLLSGDLAEAETEAHRMTLLYPKDDKLRMQYGQVLIFRNDLKGAENQLKKAIELNPKFEDAYVILARVQVTQKEQKAALATIQKMTKILPNSAKGWSLLTRLEISLRRYKEALGPAEKLWSLQHGQPESALLYGLALDLNGRSKDAVQLYEQLYRVNPSNPELVQRMVALYQEIGNLDDALNLIDEMIARTNQRHPALIMQRAIVLSELGKHEEASATLEALYSEHPDTDRLQFMSGLALERIAKLDEAYNRYDQISDESPLRLVSSYRRAFILKEQGKPEDSLSLLRLLTKRLDADATTWQVYIEFLADLKRFDEARDVATESVKAFPDKTQLRFLKGVYEERTGRVSDAEESMRAVINQEPGNAAALNFLGYMLAEQNRELDEAMRLVTKALKIKPNDGSYLDSLGWIYFQKKDYVKALEILKRALEASPKEGVIMEHVGDTLRATGDYTGAYSYYDQAIQTELEDRDRKRIESKLKETRQKVK